MRTIDDCPSCGEPVTDVTLTAYPPCFAQPCGCPVAVVLWPNRTELMELEDE